VTEADVLVERPRAALGDRLKEVTTGADCVTFVVEPSALIELAEFLRDDPELAFIRFIDLCGVDYLDQERSPRFAAVYHLHSFLLNRYARLRVPLDEDNPSVATVTTIWPGADLFEREAFDMYGFQFVGHPNLKRLLLPDEWDGHPLRKDYNPPPEPIEFSFNPEQWQKAVQRGG
jgi:NADH/F420H2 dehydrogenase subunit C